MEEKNSFKKWDYFQMFFAAHPKVFSVRVRDVERTTMATTHGT